MSLGNGAEPRHVSDGQRAPGVGMMVAAGLAVGGIIGFMMRPSVMLIGQLPFETVITRGSALSGFDRLLLPAAQQSFNVLVAGALIGGAAAFGLHRWLRKPNS